MKLEARALLNRLKLIPPQVIMKSSALRIDSTDIMHADDFNI